MTIKEDERLAVVESQVADLRDDVKEVKSDIKTLLAASLVQAATTQARANTGTWVRTILPPILSGVAAFVAAKVI